MQLSMNIEFFIKPDNFMVLTLFMMDLILIWLHPFFLFIQQLYIPNKISIIYLFNSIDAIFKKDRFL